MGDAADRARVPDGPLEVESPILNSPFHEPRLHWRIKKGEPPFKAEGRRPASYYFRIPERSERGRKAHGKDLFGETDVGQEEQLALVNLLRQRVAEWREGSLTGRAYDGASAVTRELLALWRSEERMQRLFFAQIEAIETLIFLIEAAAPYRKDLPPVPLDEPGTQARAGGVRTFTRYALKMATGAGKTTVMGMLSAWSILNRVAAPTDDRFTDTVLIVCPNVTIRERLRELDPARGDLSLYRTRQLVPPQRMEELRRGEVMITNWHRLAKQEAGKVNGQSAKVVKTGEPQERIKNAGKSNETREICYVESDKAWFKRIRQELGSGRGRAPRKRNIRARYLPDFIAVLDDGRQLIIEIKGRYNDDADSKAKAAERLVRAVNLLGEYGRWEYVVVQDPPSLASAIDEIAVRNGATRPQADLSLTGQAAG